MPAAPSQSRTLARVVESIAAVDGTGVAVRRSIGQAAELRIDPFIMLDEFSADVQHLGELALVPARPLCGFDAVTYLLEGRLRHENHLGQQGELQAGGVHWLSAGHGTVHSESLLQMPGRTHGFRFWINLPAAEKTRQAHGREAQTTEIPVAKLPGGGTAKAIAGTLHVSGRRVAGPFARSGTHPLLIDVSLPPAARFVQPLPFDHNALVYVYEGTLAVGPDQAAKLLSTHAAGILSLGAKIEVLAGSEGARFLAIAGRPLNEPIVQQGSFVLNSTEALRRALTDFEAGRFT